MSETGQLDTDYVYLEPGGDAFAFTPGPSFWPALIGGDETHEAARRVRAGGGWLLTTASAAMVGGHWEAHPLGEELIHCLSGSIGIELDEQAGVRTIELVAGQFFVMPRGMFHRVIGRQQGSQVLFITSGEGTQMKPAEAVA